MRPIKFRAWQKEKKQYLLLLRSDDFLCQLYLTPYGKVLWYSHEGFKDVGDLVEIEFFTGFLDKKGKEIYEGDIIGFIHDGERIVTGEVKWRQSVCLMAVDIGISLTSPEPEDLYEEIANSTYEVIGNIHENSELLEKA